MRPNKKIQGVVLFLIVFCKAILLGQELTETRKILEQKTNFTSKEIQILIVSLDRVNKRDLPVEFLVNRIKEGIASKASFQTIVKTITSKIEKMELANKLIEDCLIKGMKTKNIGYSRDILRASLEKGLSVTEFRHLFNLGLLHGMKLEELVKTTKLFVELTEEKIPDEYVREIITLAMVKKFNVKRIDKTMKFFLEAKRMHIQAEEAREIIIEGISKGWNLRRMRENIRELADFRKRIRKNNIKEEKNVTKEEFRKKEYKKRNGNCGGNRSRHYKQD